MERWLIRRADYIFIYTAAPLIPQRAFRDTAEAERFYQFSKTHNEAAT